MVERLKSLQVALNNVTKRINEQDDKIRKYATPGKVPVVQIDPVPLNNYEIFENYYQKLSNGYEGRRVARERLTSEAAKIRKNAS